MQLSRRPFGQASTVAAATSLAPLLPQGRRTLANAGGMAHGFSLFGDLKYGPDFAHFDYVEPNAPKDGVLHLGAIDSFSTFNPFTLKGDDAAGAGLPFESLMEALADEADSAAYGLIAEWVALKPPSRMLQAPRREKT